MRIQNPNFSDPATAFISGKKNAIQAWLSGLGAEKRFVSADEIRAQFPAEAKQLTDGTIAEIAKALGLKVES